MKPNATCVGRGWRCAFPVSLLGILAAFTAALLTGSVFFCRWALNNSKEKGLLDMESGY